MLRFNALLAYTRQIRHNSYNEQRLGNGETNVLTVYKVNAIDTVVRHLHNTHRGYTPRTAVITDVCVYCTYAIAADDWLLDEAPTLENIGFVSVI